MSSNVPTSDIVTCSPPSTEKWVFCLQTSHCLLLSPRASSHPASYCRASCSCGKLACTSAPCWHWTGTTPVFPLPSYKGRLQSQQPGKHFTHRTDCTATLLPPPHQCYDNLLMSSVALYNFDGIKTELSISNDIKDM